MRNRQLENFNEALKKIFDLHNGEITNNFYYLALDKLKDNKDDTDLGKNLYTVKLSYSQS